MALKKSLFHRLICTLVQPRASDSPITVTSSVPPLARCSDTQYGLANAQKAVRNLLVCMAHLRKDLNQFTERRRRGNNSSNVLRPGLPLHAHSRAPGKAPVRVPPRLRRDRAVDDPDRVQVPGALPERGAGCAERIQP